MTEKFTEVIIKEEEWFVARSVELGVVSQGKSSEEAKANLQEAVALYLESFGETVLPSGDAAMMCFPLAAKPVAKLPKLSGEELIAALKKVGFQVVGHKGGHVSLQKGEFKTVVPQQGELARLKGTLPIILKQCGISKEEFLKGQ